MTVRPTKALSTLLLSFRTEERPTLAALALALLTSAGAYAADWQA